MPRSAMLNVPLHRGSGHPRLVLVHGFTQSGRVWEDIARDFQDRGYEILAPDLPGHGETPPEHDTADLWDAARLLGDVGGPATYIGYSLGARTLLHLAIERPDLVERMVLVGAKAGFVDRNAAIKRTEEDDALADRIEALGGEGRFSEFIDEWLRHPVNVRLPPNATHRDLRLLNRPVGIASSLRRCGSGVQEALWDRLPALEMPVLVIFAEHDLPVIIEDNAALASAIGENAEQVRVDGVGHSVPFEAPEVFVDLVDRFTNDR